MLSSGTLTTAMHSHFPTFCSEFSVRYNSSIFELSHITTSMGKNLRVLVYLCGCLVGSNVFTFFKIETHFLFPFNKTKEL